MMDRGTQMSRGQTTRYGALAFGGLAVVMAGLTGWLVLQMLRAGGYSNEATQAVVVAAHRIVPGQPLREQDLKMARFPVSALPQGVFAARELLLEPSGRVATAAIAEGEPVLAERLASPQAGPGLAALVSAENRAVSVKVDKDVVATRLLYPGAHVDVMVTLRLGMPVTRTVLEDIRVIAVGSFADAAAVRRGEGNSQSGGSSDAVVTVEVSPQDAERLSLAAREGRIDLSLRNAADRSRNTSRGITLADLYRGSSGGEVMQAPPPPAPMPPANHRQPPPPQPRRVQVPVAAPPVHRAAVQREQTGREQNTPNTKEGRDQEVPTSIRVQ